MTKSQSNEPIKSFSYEDFESERRMELGSHLLGRDEIIEFAKEWDPI
ncbi:MAG: hypothetical protein QF493_13440 [Rhodospirillales bacterium]|jgi:hypothetical protein|nr:hypothetical protein [Rhodospirillales bacterium]